MKYRTFKNNVIQLSIVLLFTFSVQAQYGKQSDNSNTANIKEKESAENIKSAHEAYLLNDLVKMKYHIFRSQKDGFRTEEFFYLLGVYSYLEKDFKKSKYYWYTAYKRNCWECKDYIEKLKMKQPLDSILKEKSKKYLQQIER